MSIQYSKWLAIPLSTRQKIATQFGIAKNRSTSVINNVVVDDGYEIQAVENALNIEAMQDFLQRGYIDETANDLLQAVVDKLEGKEVQIEESVISLEPEGLDIAVKSLIKKVVKKPAKKKK